MYSSICVARLSSCILILNWTWKVHSVAMWSGPPTLRVTVKVQLLRLSQVPCHSDLYGCSFYCAGIPIIFTNSLLTYSKHVHTAIPWNILHYRRLNVGVDTKRQMSYPTGSWCVANEGRLSGCVETWPLFAEVCGSSSHTANNLITLHGVI